jgi:hypothetical protein
MPRLLPLLAAFGVAALLFWLLLDDPAPADDTAEALVFPPVLPVTEPATDDPWTDPDWLVPHYEKACEAVEYVCGAPFKARPTLRIGKAEELADLYRLSYLEFARRKGVPEPPPLAGNEAMFAKYARYQLGRYFREAHSITVSRDAVKRFRRQGLRKSLLGGAGVTLVLVHELTHAWQQEYVPRLWLHRVFDPDKEAAECASAMGEGHAQHVTRQVARRWGLEDWFADFRAFYAQSDKRSRKSKTLPDSANWREYVAGQDFMDAAFRDGSRERVMEALRHPPTTRKQLLDPSLWLKQRRAAREAGE